MGRGAAWANCPGPGHDRAEPARNPAGPPLGTIGMTGDRRGIDPELMRAAGCVSAQTRAESAGAPDTPDLAKADRPLAGGGLWSASHRALTLGLVLTITFIASEALAVITIM